MCTDINRIAELAKEDPKRQFFSIAHLITVEKMCEAFRSLRKDASAGIDGVTYEQYVFSSAFVLSPSHGMGPGNRHPRILRFHRSIGSR